MDYSKKSQPRSWQNKRYSIPVLNNIRNAFPPSPIKADTGQRPVDQISHFTTIKGKWASFYGSFAILLVAFFIYGLAIRSTGIIFYMIVAAILFFGGEMFYSRILADYFFQIQNTEPMPATESFNQDSVDYHETESHIVAGHHFVSIAGVAPIVGPAQAVYFGWLPCIIWVVIGSIFMGSPADFGATILGSRNNGKSIADIAGPAIHRRCALIFLLMLVLLCWLIIAVFSNLIAGLWIDYPSSVFPVNVELLIAIGLALLWKRFPSGRMHLISSLFVLVLLYGTIFFSVWLDKVASTPFKFESLCRNAVMPDATCNFGEQQLWTVWIGIYVTVVATLPVWWVVQPRDTINSHQLVVTMVLAVMGIIVGGPKLSFPAVRTNLDPTFPIFPYLFVTIACGAISGFHSLIGSANTAKQLKKATTARSVGYTSMLMESALATLAILVVCSTTTEEDSFLTWADAGADGMTNFVEGSASYFNKLGIPLDAARTIVSVMVVSFAATTVDTCGRILRMLISEFSEYIEWVTMVKRENQIQPNLNFAQVGIKYTAIIVRTPVIGSLLALVPSIGLANTSVVNQLWTLFGSTNQIIAALSLLTSGIYLVRLHGSVWKGMLYFIPFLFVAVVCLYALGIQISDWLKKQSNPETSTPENYIVVVYAFYIMIITVWIMLEAAIWIGRFSMNKISEYDKANFVKWDSKTNRTGYFRSTYPVGYEDFSVTNEMEAMEASSIDKQPRKSMIQRLVGNGGGCC